MSPIPAHCPYKAGDRVVRHGYPGAYSPELRRGFVGTVETYLGGTVLAGCTDDGRRWWETWGALWPEQHDIRAATDGYSCTCHRHLRDVGGGR